MRAEAVVRPVLDDMDRAVRTAQALSERVFGKMSVLARFKGDLTRREAVALRAHCTTVTAGQEGIVLHKMAQNALDGGTPEDMMMIYAILNANLRLNRDTRAFSNAELLALVEPAEFAEAHPLLQAIVDLRNEAGTAFAELGAPSGQVALNRIARGLAQRKLQAAGHAPNAETGA